MNFRAFLPRRKSPNWAWALPLPPALPTWCWTRFFVALLGWGLVGAAAATAIAGFHYGARNHPELQSLLRKSLVIIGRLSLLMFAFAEGLAEPLARLFVGYDPSLMALTLRGFMLYSFSFLFAGVAIFGSSFFTALNNGLISALISFLRTLLFQVGAVLIFPLLWGIDGIWLSIVAAEVMAAVVTALFLIGERKKYHY